MTLLVYGTLQNSTQKQNSDADIMTGVVIEALPNTMFRVQFDDGSVQIAYLAGKMKYHRIRVLVGDKVQVKLDPYGGKGRITRRN